MGLVRGFIMLGVADAAPLTCAKSESGNPYTCAAGLKLKANPENIMCLGMSCTQGNCCENDAAWEGPKCDAWTCPDGTELKANKPNCPADGCTHALCCEGDGFTGKTCGTHANCPADRPLMEAAKNTVCSGGNCSINKCCEPREPAKEEPAMAGNDDKADDKAPAADDKAPEPETGSAAVTALSTVFSMFAGFFLF